MNTDLMYFINTEPHEATKCIKNIAFSYWNILKNILEWKLEHCMYKWGIP